MADQTIPDYETIRAAVTGETWAEIGRAHV